MLFRGTAIVSLLTLLSRLLGFVRDLLVARLLGASFFADAFFVAFRIPNLLRSFVAEGALTAAFVPVFSSSLAKSRSEAAATFRRVGGFLLLVTIPLTIVGVLYAGEVIRAFAPGFLDSAEKFELSVTLTRIMMPYIVCVSLIAMLNSALNALGVYGTSAWAQVIMNLTLIAGALLSLPFAPHKATLVLAWSVVAGGIVQLIAQVPACRKAGLPFLPAFDILSRDIRDLIRLMLPATIGASIYQVTIFLGTLLASSLPEGSVAWLSYADRVAQLPIGIFSVALASVLLPQLSNASASADAHGFRTSLANSLRYTSFIVIPMAGGIWALALPISRVIFEHGAFTFESSVMTSRAVAALALGLWFTSCHSMIVRAFIARKDTVTPTLIGLCSLTVNILASLLLMGPIETVPGSSVLTLVATVQSTLRAAIPIAPSLGHVGIALASSIAAMASLVLVVVLFSRKIGDFPWHPVVSATSRSLAATGVMVAVLTILVQQTTWSPLLLCAAGVTVGIASYGVVSSLLRSAEMAEFLELFVRLTKRIAR